jgi:TolB protein
MCEQEGAMSNIRRAGLSMGLVLAAGSGGARAEGPYTIAFASFAPLNTAIFVADADGRHERVLVPGAAMDANPSFSPDGQWVLFTSRRHGTPDVYRVRIDGRGLDRLTDFAGFDDQAVMSPDGRHVAFVSSRSGDADIWLLDVETRALRNLTTHPGGDYRPAWSPDGTWIAFTSDRDSPGARARTDARFAPPQLTQIYVMRADGSAVQRLTTGDTTVGGASWSPDGTAITFFEAMREHWHVMTRPFPSGGVVASQIGRIDVATGARAALTSGPGRKLAPQWLADGRIAYLVSETEEQPGQHYRASDYWSEGVRFTDGTAGPRGLFASVHWSPDGRRIVFHRSIEAGPPAVAEVVSLDPQFRLLRTGTFPTFSPDGRRLAFTNGSFRVAGTGQRPPTGAALAPTRLFVVNRDGSQPRVLFADEKEGALAPAWSPSGEHIAFGLGLAQPRPGFFAPAAVMRIRPDGSSIRRLTPAGEGNNHFPSWSPDGRRLVYRSARPASKGLAILDVDSGRVTPLTSDDGADNLPSWSPDGQWIAFTSRRDGDWEVYAIHPDGTGLKRLTTSDGNDAHTAWSADSRWIAFSSARGGFKDEMARGGGGQGATDLFVMRADGTDVRRLTDDASEEGTPAFAPR